MSGNAPYRYDDIFRLLVEKVEDYAIFVLDPQGRIATWNRGAQRIKGWTEQEIIGRHFSVFYPEEDVRAGRPQEALRHAAAHGHYEYEGYRVRRDSSRFWATVVLTALRDDGGDIVGFAKVTRDLTERRRAEEALRARERMLAEAERIAQLGSWEWQVASDRVTWSDELYRIYGVGPDEFGGSVAAFLERLHPDDRAGTRAHIERALATGEPFDFEERIIRPDGAVRLLRSRGYTVKGDAGDVIRLVGTCLDITEERAREERERRLAAERAALVEAAASADRFRFLARAGDVLASSLDAHVMLNNLAALAVPELADWCVIDLVRDDGTLDRLVVAHGDAERIRRARELLASDPPRDGVDDVAGRALRTRETVALPSLPDTPAEPAADAAAPELLRRLGLQSLIACPLVSGGRGLGVVSFGTVASGRAFGVADRALVEELADRAAAALERTRLVESLARANVQLAEQATELEIQTEELQQSMEEFEVANEELVTANEALAVQTREAEQARRAAEEANRAKSDFLANMSHELRTPLNAIAGYTQLIELGVHGPVTDRQLEALRRIQHSQRHLLALINDILNFVKLEAGRVPMVVIDVNVADQLAGLEPLIAPQVGARGLMYACEPPDPDLLARADRDRLDQVLINLLSNAIKFTPSGGQIRVRCDATPNEVLIHVTDTGCGIPSDKLHLIFEPFVQIPASPRPAASEGVGLGLSISRDLMHSMGGDLTVTSEPGRGSTFTVILPRARRPAVAESASADAQFS